MTVPAYVQVPGFMGAGWGHSIADEIVARSKLWEPGQTGTDDEGDAGVHDTRRGYVCNLNDPAFDPVRTEFAPRLMQLAADAFERLRIEQPEHVGIDLHATSYPHNGYFVTHTDTGYDEGREGVTSSRRIAVIYYCRPEGPQRFGGGQLYFPDAGAEVHPAHDLLVMFDCNARHGVARVWTDDPEDPAACRLTLTGWIVEVLPHVLET